MLKKIISDKIYCGLDIGAQQIKVAIVKVKDGQRTELIGSAERKTQGFKDLSVRDLGELSECIQVAVTQASRQANVRIKEVQLGVDGELVELRESSALIPLMDRGSKVITQQDIKRVNHQAKLLGLKMDEEALHEIPQYYLVDEVNTALNPLGLYGRKLGVNSLLIVSNINRIRNITHAINHTGYDVGHLFFSSYTAADVVFSAQQKRKGCALLDIGARATSLLIFQEGILKHLSKINIASDHFTHCIAEKLNLSLDLAEDLKRSHAVAISSDQHQQEEILLKQESNYLPIKREVIYQAIEPQIVNLVGGIQSNLKASGFLERINEGIVVIGAGALLTGLIERIEQEIHRPVKLAKVNIPCINILSHAATFAASIGLAQYAFKRSIRFPSDAQGPLAWRKNLANRIKELYEEYF